MFVYICLWYEYNVFCQAQKYKWSYTAHVLKLLDAKYKVQNADLHDMATCTLIPTTGQHYWQNLLNECDELFDNAFGIRLTTDTLWFDGLNCTKLENIVWHHEYILILSGKR